MYRNVRHEPQWSQRIQKASCISNDTISFWDHQGHKEPQWTQRNTINPIAFFAENFASLAILLIISLSHVSPGAPRTAMIAKNTKAFLNNVNKIK